MDPIPDSNAASVVESDAAFAAEDTRAFTFAYTEGWGEDFRKLADVELVCEGTVFIAHSQLLCQSEVLAGAILDTTKQDEKIRIESLFKNVARGELDALLAHLYGVPKTACIGDIESAEKVVSLTLKCGFVALAQRILNALTKVSPGREESVLLRMLRKERPTHTSLSIVGDVSPSMEVTKVALLTEWVNISDQTSHSGLENELSKYLCENYFLVAEYAQLRSAVRSNIVLYNNVFEHVCSELKMWEDGQNFDMYLACRQCSSEKHIPYSISSSDLKCDKGCFSRKGGYSGYLRAKKRSTPFESSSRDD